MSYKNLEIWKLAHELVVEIHAMTLADLPKFELFEEGAQIRRSSKSVKSTIVEGYGRKKYKQEFIKFLIYANASLEETIDHLDTLYATKSLSNKELFERLVTKATLLSKKLNAFIRTVTEHHNNNTTNINYPISNIQYLTSNINYRISNINYRTSNIQYPKSNI